MTIANPKIRILYHAMMPIIGQLAYNIALNQTSLATYNKSSNKGNPVYLSPVFMSIFSHHYLMNENISSEITKRVSFQYLVGAATWFLALEGYGGKYMNVLAIATNSLLAARYTAWANNTIKLNKYDNFEYMYNFE